MPTSFYPIVLFLLGSLANLALAEAPSQVRAETSLGSDTARWTNGVPLRDFAEQSKDLPAAPFPRLMPSVSRGEAFGEMAACNAAAFLGSKIDGGCFDSAFIRRQKQDAAREYRPKDASQ
ncbi:hypothetical protein [Herbaspirillum robiniae]|uniref:Uncharacterized protein n=1 Tax=Herbaspirillum robiniae TaxID=2014887 RepID=A0A2D0B4Y1_9BURK|nr:hypothetical protein [Herbaspirillum robiniae]OWY29730.1 hypothetical protein CEJ42_07675 [Herbaspirillum robiniae]